MASPMRDEINEFLTRAFSALPPSVHEILEVGIAGDPKPSGNAHHFPGSSWTTLDCDDRYKPDIVADIQNTHLEGEQFDLIILSETLEHLPDMQAALQECRRLLRPEGNLIVTVPCYWPLHAEDGFGDYWRVSAAGLKWLFRQTGWKDSLVRQAKYSTGGWAWK